MATITTRSGKGSALTHTELDNNFTNLNTDKVEASGDTITGNLDFNDNVKARFGAGQDLEIYHDGSDSFIVDNGTGNLAIRASSSLYLQNATGTTYFQGVSGGASTLYHSGSAKLATTSTGVDVTGTVVVDGLDASAGDITTTSIGFNGSRTTTPNGLSYPIIWRSASSHPDFSSGDLVIQARSDADRDIHFVTGNTPTERMNIDGQTGDISFYEDTGTTAKFFWDASAERLGIGTTSPQGALSVSNGGAEGVEIDYTGGTMRIVSFDRNAVTDSSLEYRASQHVFKVSTVEKMRISSNGNVGIGTTDPDAFVDNGLAVQKQVDEDVISTLFLGPSSSDRGFRFAHSEFSGVRHFYHIFNGTPSSTEGTYTQGAYGGTSVIKFDNSGHLDFYTTGQAVGGSSTSVTPSHALRIDSSGNVGIGLTNPSEKLHVYDSTVVTSSSDIDVANFQSQTAGVGGAGFKSSIRLQHTTDTDKAVRITAIQTADYSNTMAMGFEVSNAGSTPPYEAMRLDANGNLFISKTDVDLTTAGIELRNNGLIAGTVDGSYVARFNRNTSDGEIVQFRKADSLVGSIGTHLSRIHMSAGAGGIFLDGGGTPAIWPWKSTATTSGDADDEVTLGDANNRWANLYLSGGVYLGGTVQANKLDDYEEGSFTPAFSGGDYSFTYHTQKGSYTKIGNRVFVDMLLYIDTTTAPSGTTNGNLSVTGLPFNFDAQNSVNVLGAPIGFKQQIVNAEDSLSVRFLSGSSSFTIHKDLSTGFPDGSLLQAADLVANSRLRIQFSYPTNS